MSERNPDSGPVEFAVMRGGWTVEYRATTDDRHIVYLALEDRAEVRLSPTAAFRLAGDLREHANRAAIAIGLEIDKKWA